MSKNPWCDPKALLEAKKWTLKPHEEQVEDIMNDLVNKELIDNVMTYINIYNRQVTYTVVSVEDVDKFRKEMVENIAKLCLKKVL